MQHKNYNKNDILLITEEKESQNIKSINKDLI